MNAARTVFLVVGLALVIFGVYMLYFQAGLDRWVSIGVVTAGLLILVGLIVASAGAGRDAVATTEHRTVEHRDVHDRDRDLPGRRY